MLNAEVLTSLFNILNSVFDIKLANFAGNGNIAQLVRATPLYGAG